MRSPRGPQAPLPALASRWRSPLRGPWLTSLLGLALLVGAPVLLLTGLLSHAAYHPDLAPANDTTPGSGLLGVPLVPWPTQPRWLYRLTQGVHVTLGVALVPVLAAKLWSVIPRLFANPPFRSLAQALERISLLLLVGSALSQFATGILNIQLEYLFPGSFYPLHFYGAWIFAAAFVLHVALRLPLAVRTLRDGGLRARLRTTAPEPPDAHGLVATDPAPPTLSRRGALGAVGLGSLTLTAVTVGQSLGGPLRSTALLAPHGQKPGSGPGGFPVNTTAAAAGVAHAGPDWTLHLHGPHGRRARLDRDALAELPWHHAALPIACVEGWSTEDQRWAGVALRTLARLVDADDPALPVLVRSLQRQGPFRQVALTAEQVADARSLLALRVNGARLSDDHGYPARVIVPAAPGVLNTKWVSELRFGEGTWP